jgi:hypothetical protein
MLLRSAAFVRIDVRVLAAQHGVIRPVQRLQAENVRARTVERKEHIDPRAKVFFKFRDGRTCVGIVSVRHYVSLVGASDRFQDLWMYSGIIVAGKAASRRFGRLRHKKTM